MENAKHAGDAASVLVAFSTLVGWLPSIAALVSIIYGAIRIYETKTVQGWVHSHKGRK
jgi:hypothetical protein